MITDGWNSQRKASITRQDPGHVEDTMMIPGGWNIQQDHQESPTNTHEKPCQGDYMTLCSV